MKKPMKWFGIVCISLLACAACKDSGGEKPKTAPAASAQEQSSTQQAAPQESEKITDEAALREEFQALWNELENFRYNLDFHQGGFGGPNGPYTGWLDRCQADAFHKFDGPTQLQTGLMFNELCWLGVQYTRSKGRDTDKTLPLVEQFTKSLKGKTAASVPATRSDGVVSHQCDTAAKMIDKNYKQLVDRNYKNLAHILSGAQVECVDVNAHGRYWIWINVIIPKKTEEAFTDDDFAKAREIAGIGLGQLTSIMNQTGWGKPADLRGTIKKPAAFVRVRFVDKEDNPVFEGFSYVDDDTKTEVWSGNLLGNN